MGAEKGDRMPDGMVPIVQEFMRTYLDVVAKQKRDPMEKVPVLKEYLGLVEDQLDEPFVFAPYHEAWTEENGAPIDHLKMDTAFMEPMLDPNDSVLLGSERVKDIEALLAKGDNVVLLSNHQTEADPSCWSFALHENHERLERDMMTHRLFPPGCVEDREDAAQVAAEFAHLQVSQLYADLVKS